MADFFTELDDKMIRFIDEQPMFFTATACAEGRINLSPKGMDTFRVIDPRTCAYLDATGSGNETAAHIRNDGRITIMFNSFTRNALILRLYGRGRVAGHNDSAFAAHVDRFPFLPGARQIIFIDIESIQTSCGYGVPEMTVERERQTLVKWAENKGPEGIEAYQADRNRTSIDGFETGIRPHPS